MAGNQLPAEGKAAGAQENDGKASEARGSEQPPLDHKAEDNQPQVPEGEQASDDEAEELGAKLLAELEAKAQKLAQSRRLGGSLTDLSQGDLEKLFRDEYARDSVGVHLEKSPRTLADVQERLRLAAAQGNAGPQKKISSFFKDTEGRIRYFQEGVTQHALYVPKKLRQSVLYTFHGLPMLGHVSLKKVWPVLRQDRKSVV